MTHISSLPASSKTQITLQASALRSFLPTLWIVARDCRNAMLFTGISMGRAFEMIYVEPYRARRHEDPANPENF
jgi:hypothetical protein